jgi:hypothetical protein
MTHLVLRASSLQLLIGTQQVDVHKIGVTKASVYQIGVQQFYMYKISVYSFLKHASFDKNITGLSLSFESQIFTIFATIATNDLTFKGLSILNEGLF